MKQPGGEKARRRIPPLTDLLAFGVLAAVEFLLHAPFLKLPYYWDELGQFVPAALDIYRHGWWIPHSAAPNVHPPAVMAYLAGFWSLAGYSVESTRTAMLLVAGAALLAAFLLAIELSRESKGMPAFLALALVCLSPLSYSQAMLAQLDMPAMLFTCLALLWFVQDRLGPAMLACVALVLTKETGLIVPAVLGLWLWHERRFRHAALFLIPAVPLAAWLVALKLNTGHLFGNTAFTNYNVFYPLHPVRLAVALVRRLYFLLGANLHWIGALAILGAWRRAALFQSRAWRVAWLLVAAHVVFFTVCGGASLERYLLPVLPVLYAAIAVAIETWQPGWRTAARIALLGGALAANWIRPWYPFPFENNLAFTDFVELQRAAARFVEDQYPGQTVATAWPLSSALARPELGYVDRAVPVRRLPDFHPATLAGLDGRTAPVLVLFSRMWTPRWSLMQVPGVEWLWERYYDYLPDATAPPPSSGLRRVAAMNRRGLWIEVWAARSPDINSVFRPVRLQCRHDGNCSGGSGLGGGRVVAGVRVPSGFTAHHETVRPPPASRPAGRTTSGSPPGAS